MTTWRRVLVFTIALIAALVITACGESSTPSTSRPAGGATASASAVPDPKAPSQSAADARRDGVIAELAALPFATRVDVKAAVPTPEGVWVLSRPTAAATAGREGCRLGPETGTYPTQTICTTEYGEVLLLDAQRTRILRAYPLPSVPPTFLRVTDDAVWCGRQGDQVLSESTLPDAMVCRIDRKTLAAKVRVFAPGAESEVLQPCFQAPTCWTVTKGRLLMSDLQLDDAGLWAAAGNGTWTHLDRTTLAVVASGVRR